MDKYSEFDYLCNEPFYIDGIGTLKCPTLRDIRKISYNIFMWYLNILSTSKEKYIETFGLKEQYELLSDDEKEFNSLYKMILFDKRNLMFLIGILNMFLVEHYEVNEKTASFDVYVESTDKIGKQIRQFIGHIGEDNFDLFRNEILKILGCKEIETKKPKYKSEKAKRLAEKIAKAKEKIQKTSKQDNNMTLDNMIRKYCTHNKVGINIMNVWDLTYYQFTTMFNEYCNGRQADINDGMAANTFSYKEASDYKPFDWMKNNNKEN